MALNAYMGRGKQPPRRRSATGGLQPGRPGPRPGGTRPPASTRKAPGRRRPGGLPTGKRYTAT